MAESAVQSAAETLTYFRRQKDFYLSHVDVLVMSLRNKLKALLKDVDGMRGYNESVQLMEVANNTKKVIDSFIFKIAQQRGETSAGLMSYQSTFNSGIKDKPAIEDLGKKISDLKTRLDEILSNRSQYGIHNIQARGETSTSSNQSNSPNFCSILGNIKRGKFSKEEELTILHLHPILGNKWSAIATHLPGRTDNEIKNFWNTHLKMKLIQMGFDPMTHRPRTDLFASLPQPIALANMREMMDQHHHPWEEQTVMMQEAVQLAKYQYLLYLLESAAAMAGTPNNLSSIPDMESINLLNEIPVEFKKGNETIQREENCIE